MRGLSEVLEMRRRRDAPSAVRVEIVERHVMPWSPFNDFDHSLLTVQVTPADDLGSIDWRPLHGLEVHLQDYSRGKNLGAIARRISEIAPKVLRVCDCSAGDPSLRVWQSGAWTTPNPGASA